jgi:hypothetical protein
MKKVILSTIAAAALTTSAMAEMKIGVGVDVMTNITSPTATAGTFSAAIGSTPVVRIAIDGLVPGLRVEPRFAFTSHTSENDTTGGSDKTLLAMGVSAYYDLSKVVSVGVVVDSYTTATNGTDTATGLTLGAVVKAEAEIAANFTVASELGYASTSTTPTGAKAESDLQPITSVTFRYFF